MKKIIILFTISLIIYGCDNSNIKNIDNIKDKKEETKVEEQVTIDNYVDNNPASVGIYIYKNGKYNLVKTYETDIIKSSDIVIFDIYPSNLEYIEKNNYIQNLYDEWNKLDNFNSLKIGFNLKYTLQDGTDISYNILDPDSALHYDIGNIYVYLYDDYKHRYDSWYSHIEQEEYNSGNTLITSLKLYAADIDNISSPITLTAFTYDGLDDFDDNDNYRGNSKYSINICDINSTCSKDILE